MKHSHQLLLALAALAAALLLFFWPRSTAAAPRGAYRKSLRERLPEVLARCGGSKSAAARELGVTRKTVYDWMKRKGK